MSRVRIDTAVGMAYVYAVDDIMRPVAKTVPMECNVDYDSNGDIIGVELFLPAAARGEDTANG